MGNKGKIAYKLMPQFNVQRFKTVVTYIMTTLFFTGNLLAQQPTPEQWHKVRDNFYLTLLRLDSAKEIIDIQDTQLVNLQVQLKDKKEEIGQLKLKVQDREQQIQQFKDREAKIEIQPLFQWQGFILGISATYPFEDSILTKTTVLNGLQYNIEGRAGVLIGQKFTLEGTIGVPLSKKKMWLKVFVGYKLF